MTTGDMVRVHPHGSPEKSAVGRIEILSENGRSIAVLFEDNPPFLIIRGGGAMIYPGKGIMLLATREALGPWVEMIGKGHYEIEVEP